MEWSEGDLVWFDPGLGHPLPGEIQEVHRAAQVIIVQALINGKVSLLNFIFLFVNFTLSFYALYIVLRSTKTQKKNLMFESHVSLNTDPQINISKKKGIVG